MPETSVRGLEFGPDGYLWLVTPHHLCRFDGVRFEEVPVTAPTNAVAMGSFEGLHFDLAGRLWVFGQDGARYYSKGVWRVALTNPLQPGCGPVRRLAEGPDGRIWLLGERALHGWREGTVSTHPLPESLPAKVKLYDVAVDGDGAVWLAAVDRVMRYRDGRFEPEALPDRPVEFPLGIYRINFSRISKRVWITDGRHVFCRENGAWREWPMPQDDNVFIRSVEFLEPRQDELWFGSKRGLYRVSPGGWTGPLFAEPDLPLICNGLTADRGGHVWVGSDGGLVRFSPTATLPSLMSERMSGMRMASVSVMNDGETWLVATPGGVFAGRIMPNRVWEVACQDAVARQLATVALKDQEGSFWIGTRGRGLLRHRNGKWEVALCWGALRADDRGLFVNALLETSTGRIWAGTSDGLMACDDSHGFMRMLPVGMASPVKTLYEDRDGALWCGYDDAGLSRVDTNGTINTYGLTDGLPGPGVASVCRDGEGVLWLGGRDGLARWETDVRPQTLDHRLQTTDHGSRIPGNGPRIFRFGREQGLPGGAVVQIVPDEQGGLWLGTSSGIARLDRKELAAVAQGEDRPLSVRLLGRDDGLPSEECTGGFFLKGWQPARRTLWFGTAAGLVLVDPRQIPPAGAAPRVVFESLSVDGQDTVGGAVVPASVRLKPGARRIVIGFTALDCAMPERTRFRYKLGDGGWSALSSERSVVFESLSPGRYPLRVAALGAGGGWNRDGAVLNLIVAPWFWQTGWFVAGVAAFMAALAAWGMRRRQLRRYRRRMAELEHQQALNDERARIARDLHDEIGSKLSRLSFLGALLHRTGGEEGASRSRAAEMVATARTTLRAFENVVWAVSPRHDTVKSLANHICRYAEEFFSGTTLVCRFKVDELLADWPVEPRVRNELFFAVKEALNNVLKHAGATTVEIVIVTRDRRLEIRIADNGCGFDSAGVKPPAAGEVHGTGLRNMRERLAALGGTCRIESGPGVGTQVFFEMEAG